MFATETGHAINPSTDYHAPERVVMDIMGWSSTAMAKRYQHVIDAIRKSVAKRVGGLLWQKDGGVDQEAS